MATTKTKPAAKKAPTKRLASKLPTKVAAKPAMAPTIKKTSMMPCQDVERRTCLYIDVVDEVVRYIPLDPSEGLLVRKMDLNDFSSKYKPIDGYPPEKACQLYLSYSQTMGASVEALDCFATLIPVSPQEYDMAAAKQARKTATTKTATKTTASKTAVKKAAAKSAAKPAGDKVAKPSAASMFKELIMAGELTDDKIFAKVQKAFDLDDNKRSYVTWYRNKLIKDGVKNVPAGK